MPYNIPSGSQFNSSGVALARSQNWAFNPPSIDVISSLHILQAQPAAVTLSVSIRDMLASSLATTHSDFNLGITLVQDADALDLFALSSSTHTISSPILLDAAVLLSMQLEVAFVDPTILLEGRYSGYIRFSITATNNSTSIVEEVDLRDYSLNLERTGSTTNLLTPRTVNMAYIQGGVSPVLDFDIIPAAAASGSLGYVLSHQGDTVVTLAGTSTSNPPFTLITGDGAVSGTLALDTTIWDSKSLGIHDTVINAIFPDWNVILGMDVNVAVFNAPGAIVTPDVLEFSTLVPDNPQEKFIDIFSTNGFTVTAPPWILLSQSSGADSARIGIMPIDVTNFIQGTYQGMVVITASGNIYEVEVIYQVNDQLETTIDLMDVNFTKDNLYLQVNGYDFNHFLQVESTIKTYDIAGTEFVTTDIVRVPFFNSSARYDVGAFIHESMSWIKDPQAAALGVLDPLSAPARGSYQKLGFVDFNLKVIDRRNQTVRFIRNLNGTKWAPGRSPFNDSNGYHFQNFNDAVARITTEGFGIINIFSKEASSLVLFKNNVEIDSFVLNGGDLPSSRLLIYGGNYLPGDIIKAQINYGTPAIPQLLEKFFVVYPKTDYSCHFLFRTSYNTLEILQCTGKILGFVEYSRQSNTVLKNGVDIINHIQTNRVDPLKVNTGFIPEDQRYMLDVFKRSLAVWLVVPQYTQPIPVSIESTELSHSDNDRFLHAYDCEFKINRDIDEQIYLF